MFLRGTKYPSGPWGTIHRRILCVGVQYLRGGGEGGVHMHIQHTILSVASYHTRFIVHNTSKEGALHTVV